MPDVKLSFEAVLEVVTDVPAITLTALLMLDSPVGEIIC